MSLPVQPSPTILLPELPPKTLVGIDLITFTSTAKFHGIRDLPSGWHFLYTGTTESFSLRSGAWFYIGDINTIGYRHNESALVPHKVKNDRNNGPEIYIWKWSTDTESLTSLKDDSDADCQEAMRHKANLSAIWQSGGLFRYRSRVSKSMVANAEAAKDGEPAQLEYDEESEESGRKDWRRLTDRISPKY
ncbi:hypothetical protein N7513_002025 [Penicillium frequentans]|nr:hypothetical protein N7513_002025 [Penicillium glabrum]